MTGTGIIPILQCTHTSNWYTNVVILEMDQQSTLEIIYLSLTFLLCNNSKIAILSSTNPH